MNKPITVKQLKKLCEEQIKKGNGNKVIMISDDEEGNGYHYLWYSFTPMSVMEEPLEFNGKIVDCCFEYADERIAKKEDTIILG